MKKIRITIAIIMVVVSFGFGIYLGFDAGATACNLALLRMEAPLVLNYEMSMKAHALRKYAISNELGLLWIFTNHSHSAPCRQLSRKVR